VKKRPRKPKPANQPPPPEQALPASIEPAGRWEWGLLALLMVGAGWLFLANLGGQYLWQDEAQTALIAQTVLTDGVPRGHDGVNSFSQELGREYGSNYLYRWHPWFPFYLLAGFFGVLGTSTFVARLPFALLGLATIPLSYFFARSLWKSRTAAVLTAVTLATSVPYLILSRQCRYYSPCAFFSLLALFAYYEMTQRNRWASAVFAVAAVLLFHSHYLYWGVVLVVVLGHAAVYHRDRLTSVAVWSFCTFLLNLPWMIWWFSPPAVGQYPGEERGTAHSVELAWQYCFEIVRHVFSPWLLGLLLVLAIVGVIRTGRWTMPDRPTRDGAALLLMFAGVTVGALAVATPFYFFRYLAPTVPVLCLLAGRILQAGMRLHPAVGVVALAAIVLFSPMRHYFYEITHEFHSPTEGIVKYLREHGKPGDVVAITYGDLPVKFYTGMRVVGGLTGEDLSPALQANWVIIRQHFVCEKDRAVEEYLSAHIHEEDFRRVSLDCFDTRFDNREEPDMHRYRTATDGPRVVIRQRKAK
jgi:hypothetical protein